MSRCQHCQKITLFCVHDQCIWRQAGGCEKCFKKYHDHSSTAQTITDKELQALYKKSTLKNDVKMKSRALQDAVSSYFTIMKTQMSSSIDAVSRVMVSKLSHPFLFKKGQISTYKKIKNKEYKKISKKELTSFYNFTKELNLEQFQTSEKNLYLQEVQALIKSLKHIDDALASYSKAIFPYDSTFKIQKSFLNKTLQISNNILQVKQSPTLRQKGNIINPQIIDSKDVESSLHEGKHLDIKRLNLVGLQKRQGINDRRVSIDVQMKGQNKFAPSVSYRENERKIEAEKKKLLDLLDSSKRKKEAPPIEEKKSRKPKIQPLKIDFLIPKQILEIKKSREEIQPPHQKKQVEYTKQDSENKVSQELHEQKPQQEVKLPEQIVKKDSPKEESMKKLPIQDIQKKESKQSSSKNLPEETSDKNLVNEEQSGVNLFANLLNMGINFPEMILHTILPRAESEKKLYEHTEQVKEKKIVIPVKQFQNQEQISSPLLKKRKKNQMTIEIKKVEESEKVDSPIKIIEEKKPQEDEKLEIKEKQANSLALLIQSLPLPAEKAIPLLQTSIKYAHNNLSAAEYLSYLYLEVGKPKQCLDLCNHTLQQMQDSPQKHELAVHISNNKAAALNILGRYSESISILQKCIQYHQQDIFYKNLADAYYSIGIYQKAIYNYEQAVHMNENLDEAHYNMSVCSFLQENYYHAEIAINKALKLVPENENYIQLRKEIVKKVNP